MLSSAASPLNSFLEEYFIFPKKILTSENNDKLSVNYMSNVNQPIAASWRIF